MKTIKMLSVVLIVLFAQMSVAQNGAMHQGHQMAKAAVTAATFKVGGNCDLCKSLIEKAAKSAGASKANWNDKTKMLSVFYEASKVNVMDIHQKIAAAGYDTDKAKATDKTYKALPSCCQYARVK
jgi:Heavy-metal-associated domain.